MIDNWVSVPTNSVITIHKQTVLLHPILDEYYGEDITQDRSSCYAVSKGLVSTAPGTTVQPGADEPRSVEPTSDGPRLDDVNRGLSHLQLAGQTGVATQCAVSH